MRLPHPPPDMLRVFRTPTETGRDHRLISQLKYDADPDDYRLYLESGEGGDPDGDGFDELTLSELKGLLRGRGELVRGNPKRETLINRLREG